MIFPPVSSLPSYVRCDCFCSLDPAVYAVRQLSLSSWPCQHLLCCPAPSLQSVFQLSFPPTLIPSTLPPPRRMDHKTFCLFRVAVAHRHGSPRCFVSDSGPRCLHSFSSIFSNVPHPSSRANHTHPDHLVLPSHTSKLHRQHGPNMCFAHPAIERAVASNFELSCTLSDSRDPTLLHHRTLLSAVGRSFLWLPQNNTAREHSTRSTSASTSSLTGANTSSCSCSRGQLCSSSSSLELWSTSPSLLILRSFLTKLFQTH